MEARGWTWAINSKNWHYFIVGLAKCGRQVKPGDGDLDDDPTMDNSPGNCPECKRQVAKMRANPMEGVNIAKGVTANENRID